MKRYLQLGVLLFLFGLAPLSAYADGPIDVAVPNNCTVVDTVGVSHAFPQDDSPSDYLGVCVLEAAKEAGAITFTLTNDPSFGLYVQSVNGISPGATEYWAIWQNGALASCGVGCLPVAQGDTLSFILTDWMTNAESTTVALQTNLLAPPPPKSDSGGGGIPNSELNVADALAYLASQQHEDGSFGSPMLSDWVAIAFAAADPGEAKEKLREYLRTATPVLSNVTDYERHAMALEALALNPYSDTSVDYISPIVHAFDGKQIGDTHLDNDDIFALPPLLSAGYTTYDDIIQKTTAFILSAQGQDGSWDESVDMTAAAIQVLIPVRVLPDVSLALIRAEGYLRSKQPDIVDPGSSFSTSWVRQAISALSGTPSGWTPNPFTKEDHLAVLQQSDGGVEPESFGTQTRVWATAYAIPAALGKPWPELLQSFSKPRASATTSTPSVLAISTPLVATSTPPAVVEVRIKGPDIVPPPRAAAREKAAIEPVLPILVDRQTAAAADAPLGDFFSYLWNAAAAFLSGLL